jgi:hypothetical protein
MTISEEIEQRGISEVLHFTTHRGVVGVLATGFIRSRFRLPQDAYLQYVLHVNAAVRSEAAEYFDKSQNWLDYVNFSISEINRRYFLASQNWHVNKDIWWAIFSYDPIIATHDGVFFSTTNNVYQYCQRGDGAEGLRLLFAERVDRKAGWSAYRGTRPTNLPTCEQAEMLYPQQVSVDFLRRIYVTCGEHHDHVAGWLKEFERPDVEVIISPEKFLGRMN